jgi:hypothetical protein
MDMQFYWIKDHVKQGQFRVGCPPGTNNGDYFTKYHSLSHHKRMRPYYLHKDAAPMIHHDSKSPVLRGCVNLCTISPTNRPQAPTAPALSVSRIWPAEHSPLSAAHHRHTPRECSRATGHMTGYINTLYDQKPTYINIYKH